MKKGEEDAAKHEEKPKSSEAAKPAKDTGSVVPAKTSPAKPADSAKSQATVAKPSDSAKPMTAVLSQWIVPNREG